MIVKCVFHKDVLHPIFGFTLKAKNGETLYGTNSQMQELDMSSIKKEVPFFISIKGKLNLYPGDYFISLGLVSMDSGEVVPYDRRYDSIHINVIDSVEYYGIFDMGLNIKLT